MAVEERTGEPAFAPKRILVPVDFSKCSGAAVGHARALCRTFHGHLTLLHVVEPAVHGPDYLAAGTAMDSLNQNLVEAARERLDQFARAILGEETRVDTLVRIGRAHSEIPDTAEALGTDLIVVGTSGRGGLKPGVLGSTVERVVRHAPCPVLTVRCEALPFFARHS